MTQDHPSTQAAGRMWQEAFPSLFLNTDPIVDGEGRVVGLRGFVDERIHSRALRRAAWLRRLGLSRSVALRMAWRQVKSGLSWMPFITSTGGGLDYVASVDPALEGSERTIDVWVRPVAGVKRVWVDGTVEGTGVGEGQRRQEPAERSDEERRTDERA